MGDCCAAGTCTMPCCEDGGEETEAPPACTCGTSDMAAATASTAEPDAAGTIGQSDLTWTLRDGVLTIGGAGSVEPFTSRDDQPWAEVREDITQVWFEDMGAVSIPDLAYWFTELRESDHRRGPLHHPGHRDGRLRAVRQFGDGPAVLRRGRSPDHRPRRPSR